MTCLPIIKRFVEGAEAWDAPTVIGVAYRWRRTGRIGSVLALGHPGPAACIRPHIAHATRSLGQIWRHLPC